MSLLHKWLHYEDNVVDMGGSVEHIEPPVEPHEPKKILDSHELCACHHICKQVLVNWKDRPDKGSTWENTSTLQKRFPLFFSLGQKLFKKGGVMS